MNITIPFFKRTLIYGIPLLLLFTIISIVNSSVFNQNSELLSLGVTVDLLFTIPFVYFLLIRKTTIPKITTSRIIVINMLIIGFILPAKNQIYFQQFKTYIFPFLEISLIIYLIYKVKNILKTSRKKSDYSIDFFSSLKMVCYEIVPKKIAMPLATELAVFYYGFIYWKKKPLRENEFSYHKNTGIITILIGFMMSGIIEIIVIHKILLDYNKTAALILTIISVYTLIQIYGFLRAIPKRPIIINQDHLLLHHGILSETTIYFKDIKSIDSISKDLEWNKTTIKLSPFGKIEEHNIVIHLKSENILTGFYGLKKTYNSIAFFVDKKEKFKTQLEEMRKVS